MEFLICDKNKMELGGIPDNVAIDFDIGDTNDVEITCERGFLDFGMYLIKVRPLLCGHMVFPFVSCYKFYCHYSSPSTLCSIVIVPFSTLTIFCTTGFCIYNPVS